MPVVPIETPSETEIVLNSIGVPPARADALLDVLASTRWLRLHGIVSIQVVATPTSGFARSSSVKPTAFSIARAGARSTPSVSAALRRLAGSVGCVETLMRAALLPAATPKRQDRRGVREAALRAPRDDVRRRRPARPRRRPTGRSRRASTPSAPSGSSRAARSSSGASASAVGLVQPVVERVASSSASPDGDRGAEQRRLRRGGGGVGVRDASRAGAPRDAAVFDARVRDDERSARAAARRRSRAACGRPRSRQIRQTPPRAPPRGCRRAPRAAAPSCEQLVGAASRPARPRPRRARARSPRRSSRARARAGSG